VSRIALSDGRWLRLLEESDARELHTAIEANREHLTPWMPWAADQTLASTLAFITRTRRQLRDNDGFQTVVVEDGRIVGVIGYHSVSWRGRSTSLGYWLTERAQGRGTMTLTVRALTDHAFETWHLDHVEIRAGVENARSRAIPERLGFTQERVLVAAELIGGRYIDQAVYVMLASDWAARRRQRSAPRLATAPRLGPDLESRGVDCRPNPPERDSG
jgi:ribosomal-protein-serine acetyltransferase